MTVKQLIELLQKAPPDSTVTCENTDERAIVDVLDICIWDDSTVEIVLKD